MIETKTISKARYIGPERDLLKPGEIYEISMGTASYISPAIDVSGHIGSLSYFSYVYRNLEFALREWELINES